MFELHPQLRNDTVVLGSFPLSLVLLSKDANYPWCLLVPRRDDIREIHHLAGEDRLRLIQESCHLAEIMVAVFSPDKMNVAALGNQVAQLHLHHVARYRNDPAWPGPVWGAAPARAYAERALEERVSRLRGALAGSDFENFSIEG